MQNNKIVFKVLNDLLQESYFELTEDKIYTVGSSDECDIFITIDVATAFSFSYVGKNLLFLSINELLELPEDIVCGKNYELPKIFKINNVSIGIGELEELSNSDGLIDEDLDTADDDLLLTEADDLLLTENEQDLSLNNSLALDKSKSLIQQYLLKLKDWRVILIITLVIILFVAILLAVVKRSTNVNIVQFSPEQSIIKLRKIIVNNPSFNGIHIIRQKPKNIVTVIGIVETNSDLLQLKNILKDPGYKKVAVDVLVFDKIKDKLSLLLAHDGVESTVHVSFNYEKGVVQITGFSNNINALTDLGFKLKMIFPNIGDIDYSNLYDLTTLGDDINSSIESFTIPSQININFDWKNNYILIQGYLDNDKINPLITNLNQLALKYASLINFKFNLASPSTLLSTRINQIHLGQPNYILVNNGDVVFEGGQIESYVLTKITKDRLYFSGKINFSINVNTQLKKVNQYSQVQQHSQEPQYTQNSRKHILLEEAAKESDTISKYEYQVLALNKMYNNSNDSKLKENIHEQVEFINSELIGLKHEYSDLLKELKNNT